MNQKEFIEKLGPLAAKEMKKSGILASLTIAQAILESGWGKSGLTVKGNALFGIKATPNWKGKVYSAKTNECYDGKTLTTITAAFRAYGSWEESVADHTAILLLPRYKALVGEKDYKKACKEIQRAGYATDPGYSGKLISLIETYNLTRFDKGEGRKVEKGSNAGGGKMKASVLIAKLEDIVKNYKTKYAWGCFGCPLTPGIVASKAKQYPEMYDAAKRNELIAAGKTGAFGFDCVNVIKGLLWGWTGRRDQTWGGANYNSNGVPDINADQMIAKCSEVSTDFSKIVPGEAVWLPGHIGVYIGGGVVIEATPIWKNGVQKTALANVGSVAGLPGRAWKKHGKMPYVIYDVAEGKKPNTNTQKPGAKKSVTEIAREVIDAKWGNGADREARLKAAGYDYNAVQAEVNRILSGKAAPPAKKSVTEIAKEVINGEWGNGNDRRNRLQAAGYNYNAVQAEVNKLLRG